MQNANDYESQIEEFKVCSDDKSDKMQRTNVRELRPFNPLLRSAHLESEPIKVIIDYIDSPTENTTPFTESCEKWLSDDSTLQNTVLVHSPDHTNTCSITDIGNINDKTDTSKTNNPIFTLATGTSTTTTESNGYSMGKENTTKSNSCPCSKSTFKKLCENPKENTVTRFTNTHHKNKILDNKNNPSWPKMKTDDKDKQINAVDKKQGCRWTCGTKMFSKSEKVRKIIKLYHRLKIA